MPLTRTIVSGVAALALIVPMAGLLSGCAIVDFINGTDSQQSSQAEDADASAADPNTVSADFDGLKVSLNTDTGTWQWSSITDTASSEHGSLVVGIPIHLANTSDGSFVLNSIYCSVVSPDGTVLPDISSYTTGDVLSSTSGSISSGSESDSTLHVLYKGPGTYHLLFDNMLGVKDDLAFVVSDARLFGVRALPNTLTSDKAAGAIPAGTTFVAEGVTITLSDDRDAYAWIQMSAPDSSLDGAWVVGVPITVTNTSASATSIGTNAYVKFDPYYTAQSDPAPYMTGTGTGTDGIEAQPDITSIAQIGSNQTVTAMIYFLYVGDGDYYLAMDNDGSTVVAKATIAQYY